MNTKERILYEALKLFSVHGYQAVSVRQIAASVAIKESSLYNHYVNKQAIFDSIVEHCYARDLTFAQSLGIPFQAMDSIELYKHIDEEGLIRIADALMEHYLEDEYAMMFKKLLVVSQYENEALRKIYMSLYYEQPIAFQSKIFEMLIEHGGFRKVDPEQAAYAFYAPLLMMMNSFNNLEEAKVAIRSHVKHFRSVYLES